MCDISSARKDGAERRQIGTQTINIWQRYVAVVANYVLSYSVPSLANQRQG